MPLLSALFVAGHYFFRTKGLIDINYYANRQIFLKKKGYIFYLFKNK